MRVFGQKDANYLKKTRVTFKNIDKDPAIAAELEKVSYDATRLGFGKDLHTEAKDKFRELVEKRQTRLALTERLKERFKLVYTEYVNHVQRLRSELISAPDMLEELDLLGKRKSSIAGFIEQAAHLYKKTIHNTEIAAQVLPFGFTAELLTASEALFLQYQEDRDTYEKSVGELQKLKVEKDLAFKALRIWMNGLRTAARVVFAHNLQTLEEIGFFVRNKLKSRKKADPPTTPPDAVTTEPPGPSTGTPGEPPTGLPQEPVIAA